MLAVGFLLLAVELHSVRTASAGDNAPAPVAAHDPTAVEMLSPWILSIGLEGNGFGNVASAPGMINCGSQGASCTDEFVDGTLVTLIAIAEPKSTFAGWSGDAACADQFTMSADTICTATFITAPGEHVFADGFEG